MGRSDKRSIGILVFRGILHIGSMEYLASTVEGPSIKAWASIQVLGTGSTSSPIILGTPEWITWQSLVGDDIRVVTWILEGSVAEPS